jgi:hypothetical protein
MDHDSNPSSVVRDIASSDAISSIRRRCPTAAPCGIPFLNPPYWEPVTYQKEKGYQVTKPGTTVTPGPAE